MISVGTPSASYRTLWSGSGVALRRIRRTPFWSVGRTIDLSEDVQRHTLATGKRPPEVFSTELTRLQKRIIRLLGIPKAYSE